MAKLIKLHDKVQKTVSENLTSLEKNHKELSDKSFEFVSKIEKKVKTKVKGYTIADAQKNYNKVVTDAFAKIRELNEKISEKTGDFFTKVDEKTEKSINAVNDQVAKLKGEEKKAAKKETAKKATAKKAAPKKAEVKAEEAVAA